MKGPKPRKVFGRRMAVIDGVKWKFEMRKDRVYAREYRKHREWLIPFQQFLRLARIQTELFDEESLARKKVKTAEATQPDVTTSCVFPAIATEQLQPSHFAI